MEEHGITHVVAKNAGGDGARAKLDAARVLGLPVLMAERPVLPETAIARTPDEVLDWVDHTADRGV
jgi:precorrin-6A/cobalt-precorrin-6A reductase